MAHENESEAMDIEVLIQRAARLQSDHRTFMKQLVEARRKADLSQDEVAERMGVTQPAVSKFERYDSNPTLDTIRRYALAVGVGLRSSVLQDPTDDWKELMTAQRDLHPKESAAIDLPWRPLPAASTVSTLVA